MPDVAITHDRVGQARTITDGMGTRTFTYNDALQLAAETNAFASISRDYDSLGRPTGYTAGANISARTGYDSLGRLSSATSGLSVVNYAYLPGSELPAGWTSPGGLSFQRTFEPHRNLIATITNSWNGTPLSTFEYANDSLARRTRRVDNSAVTNDFGYNLRSEVTSAAMGTNQYSYGFDPIGNRRLATNNATAFTYTANSLNQYTNILRVSAPPRETLPTHDADGNMTFLPSDAGEGWHCQWDGENRLASASNAAVNARYSYDYMSRRSQKITGGVTNRFLYDGWNLIAEIIDDNGSTFTNTYTWGLDLSGTPQGSGGIGGLLAVTHDGAIYFPSADANGNITDYVDANGAVVAHRDFDAFGNTTHTNGPLVNRLHFWFSSKYLDEETGLYYYGYRYYCPELGRWLNKDPIRERGGANLYYYCANDGINWVDMLGLEIEINVGAIKYPVPPDGKKDAIDKMLEESALIHVRSTSAKAFYDGVKRMYDRCIANSRKTTAAEKHQECCLSKLARYGHSSAGLGGAEGFEKLDQVQIQNIRMMFCANAKFVEYGCYAFSLDSLPIYISHLHYADLLTESGGSYEGYLGMALYGYPFPNIFSSRSDETTMTSLPVEKGEAKSELEKKFHQIYPPSHREETSVPIIDGDVTVIITLPEVH